PTSENWLYNLTKSNEEYLTLKKLLSFDIDKLKKFKVQFNDYLCFLNKSITSESNTIKPAIEFSLQRIEKCIEMWLEVNLTPKFENIHNFCTDLDSQLLKSNELTKTLKLISEDFVKNEDISHNNVYKLYVLKCLLDKHKQIQSIIQQQAENIKNLDRAYKEKLDLEIQKENNKIWRSQFEQEIWKNFKEKVEEKTAAQIEDKLASQKSLLVKNFKQSWTKVKSSIEQQHKKDIATLLEKKQSEMQVHLQKLKAFEEVFAAKLFSLFLVDSQKNYSKNLNVDLDSKDSNYDLLMKIKHSLEGDNLLIALRLCNRIYGRIRPRMSKFVEDLRSCLEKQVTLQMLEAITLSLIGSEAVLLEEKDE
ncbi:MAG: hypothetical protein MHPSP_001663, partial [Paramarteilia canceri]